MSASRCSMTKGASGSARPPRVASTSAKRPRPALPVESVIQGTFRAPASSSALLRRVVYSAPGTRRPERQSRRGRRHTKARAATDAPRATSTYTLEGIADRIACPTLVLEAENDHVFAGEARRVAAALRCPHRHILLTDAEGAGEHCHEGAMLRFHQ